MHTVQLLEEALATAKQLGYRVRYEYLGGEGTTNCEIRGKRWIFVDLGQPPEEQLERVMEAIEACPEAAEAVQNPQLLNLLRRAA